MTKSVQKKPAENLPVVPPPDDAPDPAKQGHTVLRGADVDPTLPTPDEVSPAVPPASDLGVASSSSAETSTDIPGERVENSPPPDTTWLSRHRGDFAVATLSGILSAALVGVGLYVVQYFNEEDREATAARLENLRFVRALSSQEIVDRPFRGLDLRGMNLSGLNLVEADFVGADLSGAQLEGSKLIGADFTGADLHDASFRLSDLTGAELYNVNLAGVDFYYANLSGAALDVVPFVDAPQVVSKPAADWEGAQLNGAVIGAIDFANARTMSANNLVGARFAGVDLSHVTIEEYTKHEFEAPLLICVNDVRLPADLDTQYVSEAPDPCIEVTNKITADLSSYLAGEIDEIPREWWSDSRYYEGFGAEVGWTEE